MSRLHVYTAHINPALPTPYEEAVFVEEGFNWKAFLFTGLWTLYNRLWLNTLVVALVTGVIVLFYLRGLSYNAVASLLIACNTIIGYHANDWLRSRLKRRGFVIADIVTGDSILRAEQRFFDRYFSAKDSTPAFSS